MNSLRHIKPVEGDDERQWRWTSEEVIRLQNPDTQDDLLNSETARDEFDITGLRVRRHRMTASEIVLSSGGEGRC